MQKSVFSTWITSVYGSQPSSVVFAGNTACLASELLVSMGPSPHVRFFDTKQRLLDPNKKSLWLPNINLSFCACKWGVFSTWITSVYGSLTWTVVLCMQRSVISTWITSLYGSLPSCAVFGCKTATYGLEWLCYMGSSHHLCFASCKTATLWPDLQLCMVPRPLLWFWAHITACLAQE